MSPVLGLSQQDRRACKAAGQGSGGKRREGAQLGDLAAEGEGEVQAGQQSKAAEGRAGSTGQGSRAARQQGGQQLTLNLQTAAEGRSFVNISLSLYIYSKKPLAFSRVCDHWPNINLQTAAERRTFVNNMLTFSNVFEQVDSFLRYY